MMDKKRVALPDLSALLKDKRAFIINSNNLVPLSLETLKKGSSKEIIVKHCIKKLSAWFHAWHSWQKRILICHLIGFCSKRQLELLATSLEPILHMDFSSSLLPPLQDLHLDSVSKFQIQRTITQKVINPEVVVQIGSQEYLNSLPTTFLGVDTPVSSGPSDISMATHLDESILEDTTTTLIPEQHPGRGDGKGSGVSSTKKQPALPTVTLTREPILPAIPLTHPDHLPDLRRGQNTTSFNDISSLRQKKFCSVPDFTSTTRLLKKAERKRDSGSRRRERSHSRSKSVSAYSYTFQHRAEQFKEQLMEVGNWMERWEDLHKSYFLTEMVKLCDKYLLGYFVQCLYQHMKDQLSINSLPDSILGKIFSNLSAEDLCSSSQVCKDWNLFCNSPSLWRNHTYSLGIREGVGNLAEVVETVVTHYRHSLVGVDDLRESEVLGKDGNCLVDWKRAYIDLNNLVLKMKELILQNVEANKAENDLLKRIETTKRSHIHFNFSLMEMLDILRVQLSVPNATTYDLIQYAPESASAMRRKLRAQRRSSSMGKKSSVYGSETPISKKSARRSGSLNVSESLATWSPSHNLEFAQHLMSQLRESGDARRPQMISMLQLHVDKEWLKTEWLKRSVSDIEYAKEALDMRPTVPHLPDPDGIKCLILAGGLLSGCTVKPGCAKNIPKIRRLQIIHSRALCLQSDSRKVVIGSADKTIKVIDIRSGCSISTLVGHKGSVQCLQFDDFKIVSGSWDTSIIIWDVVHFIPLKQLNGHVDCVSCLQFDEDILVTGSYDGSLRVWSTSTWDHISIINRAHSDGVTCLAFNRRIIASGGNDKNIKIWSVSTYFCLRTLPQCAPLSALALSHLLLVSSSLQGDVVFWNLDSGLPVINRRLKNKVYFKKFAQSHSKFYGAGSDGLIYEVDISTGTCTRTLKGHNDAMTALWISDHKIISAGMDCTVLAWYFKKALKKRGKVGKAEIPVVKVEELEGSEEEEEEEEDGEESELTSDFLSVQEFRYRAPKYFENIPLRIVTTDNLKNGFIPV